MNKYETTLRIDRSKGAPFYETAIVSAVPEEEVPFYYITQEGDRLDTISNLFYKTPDNWWVIAKANNLADGSIAVDGGVQLFIPNI